MREWGKDKGAHCGINKGQIKVLRKEVCATTDKIIFIPT